MLSNNQPISRPRPPAQVRRTSRTLPLGASPPPPYVDRSGKGPILDDDEPSFQNYLGSPLPATLQMVGRNKSQPSSPHEEGWLNEKSREELAVLLHKADDLIRERETELGVTSAVCKSLYENNVSLKSKHDALLARFPSSDSPSSSQMPLPDEADDTPFQPRSRKVTIHASDISLLADQNAELLHKLQTLEEEAQVTDRQGRRALKQLEKEISLLRDELEKTQARSEQLEKQAQVAPEKIVEELWRKKKEREAKFRAMRNNNTPTRAPWPFADESAVRDFAPPGPSKGGILSPAKDASYGDEHPFEYPDQHMLVSQLLDKIKELEDTNTRIIQQQSETADKLQAVQRETESISKVYEYFSPEKGIQWQVVADDGGPNSPVDGTIRFRSFRRSLDSSEDDDGDDSMMLPRRGPRRGSVLELFEEGISRPDTPVPGNSLDPVTELSPLHFHTPSSERVQPRQTLQAELGEDFVPDAYSRYRDFSFNVSPSPSMSALPDNALRLSVEPPTPTASAELPVSRTGSLREKNRQRQERMTQTLFLRSGRWQDGRFSSISSASSLIDESTPKRELVSIPQRLSSAFDVVMENFGAPEGEGEEDDKNKQVTAPATLSNRTSIASIVFDEGGERKRAFVAFVLEAWLWLQFAVVIVVFLWAMAKRGPKSVLGEADRRAVVKRG
uniref:Uncharacterized protein n=1 Tax=Mycena chlorophos TaxID=658473 RepID=A0ABQ0M8Z3_MYCCL|nr:predicted protein [Mycena chlorophos]